MRLAAIRTGQAVVPHRLAGSRLAPSCACPLVTHSRRSYSPLQSVSCPPAPKPRHHDLVRAAQGSVAKSHLGKRAAADLRRGMRRARGQYRQRRYCASVKSLGHVVERATKRRAGGRVARSARSVQRAIFVKRAARGGRCGLAPRFRVAHSVTPDVERLAALADGHPRVVARLASADGVTDFVQDELVVQGTRAAAAKLAGRWHGNVLDTAGARPTSSASTQAALRRASRRTSSRSIRGRGARSRSRAERASGCSRSRRTPRRTASRSRRTCSPRALVCSTASPQKGGPARR